MEDEVEKMALSKKKYQTNKKFNDKTYDHIGFAVRKEEKLKELITFAANKSNQTISVYIIEAIKLRLISDGVSIDMLPSDIKHTIIDPEPKQPKQYIIYMITEQYDRIDDEEKYIATFPTLNMAEKYAKNKFEKKAHPNKWSYTIYGRSVEEDNKSDACNKLKAMIREELKYDKEHGIRDDGSELTYVDRLNERAPADYTNVILYDGEYVEEDLSIEDFEL